MPTAIYRLKKDAPGAAAGTEFLHYSLTDIWSGEDGMKHFSSLFTGGNGILCIKPKLHKDFDEIVVLPIFVADEATISEWFLPVENLADGEYDLAIRKLECEMSKLIAEREEKRAKFEPKSHTI